MAAEGLCEAGRQLWQPGALCLDGACCAVPGRRQLGTGAAAEEMKGTLAAQKAHGGWPRPQRRRARLGKPGSVTRPPATQPGCLDCCCQLRSQRACLPLAAPQPDPRHHQSLLAAASHSSQTRDRPLSDREAAPHRAKSPQPSVSDSALRQQAGRNVRSKRALAAMGAPSDDLRQGALGAHRHLVWEPVQEGGQWRAALVARPQRALCLEGAAHPGPRPTGAVCGLRRWRSVAGAPTG